MEYREEKGNGDRSIGPLRTGEEGMGGLSTYYEVMSSVSCIFYCLLYKNGVVYMIFLEWAE